MIWQNLDGTTKDSFSIGIGSKRVDYRTNSGVNEARRYGGDWHPVSTIIIMIGAPDTDDDDSDTGGNGIFAASDLWFDDSPDELYICKDASTGAAVWTKMAGGSGGGLTWSKITGNTTAVAGNGYAAVAAANLTLTLPATPSAGNEVWFVDAADKATTYTLTIARNSENIESVAQDLVVDTDGSGFGLVFVDATVGWKIVTEITAGASGGTGVEQLQVWNFA